MFRHGELAETVKKEIWFHSIDLGDGIVTKGQKTQKALAKELSALRLPDVRGKEVLDIGALDGFYSFEAEQRGARRVVALDLQAWEVETNFSEEYRRHCLTSGCDPDPPYKTEWLQWSRRPAELPGKRRFDIAHRVLGSRVEAVVRDFMRTGPEDIGTFDVVLFLGVLYHMQDPLGAMKRVASLTRQVAVIETEAMFTPALEQRALCEFFPSNELNGDYTNWWAPNGRALTGLCRAAGFNRVDIVQGPPMQLDDATNAGIIHYRAMCHAWK
jgi:tRNA (mo5U34)-methyltransferase